METNLFGTWAVIQAHCPHSGVPATLASSTSAAARVRTASRRSGLAVNPSRRQLRDSKAAVHALTAKLATELRAEGIRVDATDPGLTATAPGMESMGARRQNGPSRSRRRRRCHPIAGRGRRAARRRWRCRRPRPRRSRADEQTRAGGACGGADGGEHAGADHRAEADHDGVETGRGGWHRRAGDWFGDGAVVRTLLRISDSDTWVGSPYAGETVNVRLRACVSSSVALFACTCCTSAARRRARAWMAAELAEHGYSISPGTLYQRCIVWRRTGCCDQSTRWSMVAPTRIHDHPAGAARRCGTRSGCSPSWPTKSSTGDHHWRRGGRSARVEPLPRNVKVLGAVVAGAGHRIGDAIPAAAVVRDRHPRAPVVAVGVAEGVADAIASG